MQTAEAQRYRAFLLIVFVPLWFMASPAFGQTVWHGIYTVDQARRGEAAYSQYCARCHKADLLGIEAALRGESFMERRREDNLETLFLDMKATMPRGNPGGLPDQTYADILSYILEKNEMPAGSVELKANALAELQLVGKDGPKPVPNFALVLSVGCLVQTGQDSWILTHASEPVRTRDPFKKIDKELADSKGRALGEYTFRLQDAGDFEPQPHMAQKVQVKGVLVRSPNGARINVNSIEGVSENCP